MRGRLCYIPKTGEEDCFLLLSNRDFQLHIWIHWKDEGEPVIIFAIVSFLMLQIFRAGSGLVTNAGRAEVSRGIFIRFKWVCHLPTN